MKFFEGIKKNVVILGIASFLTDVSSEMLYPIVPIFLTSVLGAPMSIVGLIEGIAESTASILKGVSGWLSDRVGRRRPFVVAGYSLSTFAKPILFLAYTWHVVLVARFLDRLGKGLRTSPRDAMIADATDIAHRGKSFGFHRGLDTLGAILGPLFAVWFLTYSKENLRPVFLLAFIPAILAVLTLIFFLKEAKARTDGDTAGPGQVKMVLPRQFKMFLLASAVFAAGNSSDAFLIVRSKGLGLSVIAVILAYVLYNISYSALSTPFGWISDKIPRKTVMIAGYLIFAAVYLGFGFINDSKWIWFLFPVYGCYMALTDGVGKAFASDMVEAKYRATALGLYHLVLGIFAFSASLIAGLLWTRVGISAPFIFGAVMAVGSCVLLAYVSSEKMA